jgi:hypothetical protein
MQKRDITKLIVTSLDILTISSIIFFVTHDTSNTITAIVQSMTSCAYPFGSQLIHFRFGTIGSIQNGEEGRPRWILSGVWKTNLLINQTMY